MLGQISKETFELSEIATARGKHLCRPLTRAWMMWARFTPRSPPGGVARRLYAVAVFDG
ncbi:MAG: hypothetical protein M3430_09320 [Acidobacteriota bacterium]|nr:hypothetical protein [Acidobacteriota bacterium]